MTDEIKNIVVGETDEAPITTDEVTTPVVDDEEKVTTEEAPTGEVAAPTVAA